MATIQITIQKNAERGKNQVAMTYNVALEGDNAEFNKIMDILNAGVKNITKDEVFKGKEKKAS